MSKPTGLFYFKSIIDKNVQDKIMRKLDKLEWTPLEIKVDTGHLVQQYGYAFNYETHDVEQCASFPHFIQTLQDILRIAVIKLQLNETNFFNQCIVNNYFPGEGISAHIDAPCFGDVIGCFTIGSGAEMTFTSPTNHVERLFVEPGSLYVMSGESRYEWTHKMAAREYDIVGEGENAKLVKRGRRISVTFRYVKE